MPENLHTRGKDFDTQQYFALLDRREKTSDWFLAIYGIAILLLMVVGSILLLS